MSSQLIFTVAGKNITAVKNRAFVLVGDILTIKQGKTCAFSKDVAQNHNINYEKTAKGHKGIISIPLIVNKDIASKHASVKEAMRVLKKQTDVSGVHLSGSSDSNSACCVAL